MLLSLFCLHYPALLHRAECLKIYNKSNVNFSEFIFIFLGLIQLSSSELDLLHGFSACLGPMVLIWFTYWNHQGSYKQTNKQTNVLSNE